MSSTSIRMLRRTAPLLAFLVLTAAAPRAAEAWKIRPEMQLPMLEEIVSAAAEQLATEGFEAGTGKWTPRSGTVKIRHDASGGHESKGCLRVQGTDEKNWNFAASPQFPVEAGKAYRVVLWVRRDAEPEGTRDLFFKVEFMNKDPKKGSRVNSKPLPLGIVGEWRRLMVEFVAPEGCDKIWIAIEKGGNNPSAIDASIDDFALERLDSLSMDARFKDAKLVGPIEKELAGVHPRIYMTAAKLEALRADVKTNPKWAVAMKALMDQANRGASRPPDDYAVAIEKDKKSGSNEQLWQRNVGNVIPHIALAYLLTGDAKYLDATKKWVLTSLDYPTWGLGSTNNMDLAAGHQMAGIGLAYDWLYQDLTDAERRTIREKLVIRGNDMTRASGTGRAWWNNSYMQNHQWVSVGGLATAGFAVCDESPEAKAWIHLAHQKIVTTLDTLGDDGASHEGYGYWEYGSEYIMRYMEMSRDLLGIDLYRSGGVEHPWLKNNAYYALHLAMPLAMWSNAQSVIDLGDCPRTHWYGPSYLLRNQARRFAGSTQAGLGQWLATQMQLKGVDAAPSGTYLNMVWYDPALPETAPNGQPTMHHFSDLEIVSSRSAWEGLATQLVVKCGPPLGRKHVRSNSDYGAGHVHPDCGHFTLLSRGQVLFRDEGYSHPKLAAWHNTMLIDGKGQKGEGKDWFRFSDWISDRGDPRIVSAESTPEVDTIVCDPTEAYRRDAGLRKWTRRFEFHKPDRLIVTDDVEMERPADLEWRMHCEGTLVKNADGSLTTTKGNAAADVTIAAEPAVEAVAGKVDSGRDKKTSHDCVIVKTVGKQARAHIVTTIVLRDAGK